MYRHFFLVTFCNSQAQNFSQHYDLNPRGKGKQSYQIKDMEPILTFEVIVFDLSILDIDSEFMRIKVVGENDIPAKPN